MEAHDRVRERTWWRIAIAGSVVMVLLVAWMWYRVDTTHLVEANPLTRPERVDAYLEAHDERYGSTADEEPIAIRTGVFLQSLAFVSACDISISGYVWQVYLDGVHDGLDRGFVLPEAIDSNDGVMEEVYRRPVTVETADGPVEGEVIGWYVEATLRQRFDYSRYPLDHKEVWIRMWHTDFDRNVVLVPDLGAYDSTLPGATFGVEEQIVLAGWDIEKSFFRYVLSSYDTNFGIADYVGQDHFPELHFNLVIRRNFLNAFFINLVPLLLIAGLLFAVLMTVTDHPERRGRLGFNDMNVIGAASALFFVVLLAHIQLREQFESDRLVYLERFHLLMYLTLLLVSVFTYVFSVGHGRIAEIVRWRDGLAMKLAYWPYLTGSAVPITLLSFASIL